MSPQHRYLLPAVLTQRDARSALQTMGVAAGASPSGAGAWSVDASALIDFDSSALAVLLACKRLATAAGCALLIERPPEKLVRLAGLYGVEEMLLGDAAS